MTESRTCVLVVEDEPSLAELFTTFLEEEYSVLTATSGEEALSLANDDLDIVLLDRRMPEMSGDDVLIELNKRDIDAQYGMISGVEPDVDIVDLPFDDYMIKPIGREEILNFIESLMLRTNYSECGQQYFRLASKKAALEIADNTNSTEYQELVDRMDTLRNEIDETLDLASEMAASDPPLRHNP